MSTSEPNPASPALLRISTMTALAITLAIAIGVSGCSSDSSSSNNEQADTEPDPVTLTARPDQMQIHLSWAGQDSVDIIYSSDRNCDWSNYSTCDDSGMLPNQTGGQVSIVATEEGLNPDTSYFFVADAGDMLSDNAAARAMPPGFGNHVRTSAVGAEHIYVGGNFDYQFPVSGGAISVSSEDGTLTGPTPPVDGRTRDIISDGDGGWFIGGDFESVGGMERQGLARLRPDGSVDTEWHAEVNDDVYALALADGKLFVGGEFSEAGVPDRMEGRENLAVFDLDSGDLSEDWNIGASNDVLSLVADRGALYVGGSFDEIGEHGAFEEREGLAVFDLDAAALSTTWEGQVDRRVESLALQGSRLFVGGRFDEAGTPADMQARPHLAAFDADSGILDEDWNAVTDGTVYAVAADDQSLFIGGNFDEAGADGAMAPRENLAAFNLSDASLRDDWRADTNNEVQALSIKGSTLFLGGRFTELEGEHADHFARLNRETGDRKDGWTVSVDERVRTIHHADDVILLGGRFQGGDAVRANHLARFNRETGLRDTEWQAGVDDNVRDLTLANDRIYVLGDYTSAGSGETVTDYGEHNALAAFDKDEGAVHPDWNDSGPWDGAGQAMAIHDGRIYVTGYFAEIGLFDQMNGLAAFDALSGKMSAWNAGLWQEIGLTPINGYGESLAVGNDHLIVGGIFQSAGKGQDEDDYSEHENIAAFDFVTGEVDSGWQPGTDGRVTALAVHDNEVFAGGNFQAAGTGTDADAYDSASRLAVFSLDDGSHRSDWTAGVDGSGTSLVQAVTTREDGLIVGGDFDEAGSDDDFEAREQHAAFGLSDGRLLEWDPVDADRQTNSLTVHDDIIFSGGRFERFETESEGIYRLRPGFVALDADTGEIAW